MLILCSEPLDPLTLVRCYPIGVMSMVDSGRGDEKIIAVPFGDPMYNSYKDISELPEHIFEEMKHFFIVYKALENKQTAVKELFDQKEAVEIIRQSIEDYKKLMKIN